MSGLDNCRRWRVLDRNVEVENNLIEQCGVSSLVAQILAARGIKNAKEANEFLYPSLDDMWQDPLCIPGMKKAAEDVASAIKQNKCIAIFGDFDVDGMSSTCLLTHALRKLGANVHPFIPHRFDEGYGLSKSALERVIESCNPDLIVTVDNGISAKDEVAWLIEQGIDVVITDHHEPADLVPENVAVTDPKLSDTCPSRELAGAGVALKLVNVLGPMFGQPHLWRDYIDMASLGTVSDMMELDGQNRALVKAGIAQIRKGLRPGLVALSAVANCDITTITADSLPFTLIPRLNAAGRMGCTEIAFNLLLCEDPKQATILAGKLESVNQERREIEASLSQEAINRVEASYTGQRVVVVAGEGWHEGVKGIVASRLVNRYHVPAILFTISDGVARGSGRSVGSIDLFKAVSKCDDLLIRFGGHAGAVGVTIDVANLDAFRARMEEVLEEIDEEEFVDTQEIAAVVPLSKLTLANIQSLEMMQPFGMGNKRPLLATRSCLMTSKYRVGQAQDHMRFMVTDGCNVLSAIMFRVPQIERASTCEEVVDLVFDAIAEEWQGRVNPKLMVKDIIYNTNNKPQQSISKKSANKTKIDELFDNTDKILLRDEYAGVAEAESFYTKVVGISFDGRQRVVDSLDINDELKLVLEPNNPNDSNAIALVTLEGKQLGYLRRQIAASIAPNISEGYKYVAHVMQITGDTNTARGVNIEVRRKHIQKKDCTSSVQGQAKRRALQHYSYETVVDEIRKTVIGDYDFLPAQKLALEKLEENKSCLCVMATGRGKSAIFHVHAARLAILENKASIFVFPLRALVTDQAFHLKETFESLGLVVKVLTGETTLADRDIIFKALNESKVDIVLTTPEFLAIHTSSFANGANIGFVVIDEAHHAGISKSGNRASYQELPCVLEKLGEPTVLAVTATAATPVASEIIELCGIDKDDVIIDKSLRDNLHIVDNRNLRSRDHVLITTVASKDKTVCYVNSREQTVTLAKMLRKAIPQLAHQIAFYNAGMTKKERKLVEKAFRDGEITCIVSTSAFGEGVNLPNIRHVFLYHMPFGSIEFNQMSGRAGRDNKYAEIHLMYSERDAKINERILSAAAPSRQDLIALYKTLKSISAKNNNESFSMTNADIAQMAHLIDSQSSIDEQSVSCGISVFRELGFLNTSGYGSARRISMVQTPIRMELNQSIRYLEGIRELDDFGQFRQWALTSTSQELLARINRPITPKFGFDVEEDK